MRPWLETSSGILYLGKCIEVLRNLPDKCIHTCVTSPPYFGLRDYGVDGQIGLEPTVDEYVAALLAIFTEVHRVLADDGTLWLNLGDSYNAHPGQRKVTDKAGVKQQSNAGASGAPSRNVPDLKPKDLIGIPWRVAFALQADGWYLRQDIIWSKPNPMPESVTDRCTKAHEYIFLLSKSERYYYDHVAVKEDAVKGAAGSTFNQGKTAEHQLNRSSNAQRVEDGKRNRRSVWTVTPKPYKGAHFATFPPDLIEPCILAGCPPGGMVLDPFMGSGTTAQVAERHGRNWLGIELNPTYCELVKNRLTER